MDETKREPTPRQLDMFEKEDVTPEEIEALRTAIRLEVLEHRGRLKLDSIAPDDITDAERKERVRHAHGLQRETYRATEAGFVSKHGPRLLREHFADGSDIVPEKVEPVISLVNGKAEDSRLFRLATLWWSVPVSRGYGRRMRFLVRDSANGKLMGIFALADPVFNIRSRDEWIGWSAEDRRQRLVNVMDAYIVGAMPPYNQLLGGKIVASLMTSEKVRQAFTEKYENTTGQISKQQKRARLVLITVTSALGRSSLYNRLRLPDLVEFQRIGLTEGWGHYHISNDLFEEMRRLLRYVDHKYWFRHQYGEGPNWKMRVVRAALTEAGLDGDLLRHGVRREVFAAPLITEWREFLQGSVSVSDETRPTADEIAQQAVQRWLIPRAERRPEYREWTKADTWQSMTGQPLPPPPPPRKSSASSAKQVDLLL